MDRETIDSYNQIAPQYNENTMDFWDKFPRHTIDTFISLVQTESSAHTGKVADIGSGPGRDGKIFQDAGLDVVCFDASSTMLELAQEKGLRVVQGDFESMPFQDNSLEGVWAYTSLLHVPKKDIDTPVSEIGRILKPHGIFGLGLIEGDSEEYKTVAEKGTRFFSFYTPAEAESLLKRHGFTIEYFEKIETGGMSILNYISRKS